MGRSHRPSCANGTAAAGSQRFTHVPTSMSVKAMSAAGAAAAGVARRAGTHRAREPTSGPAPMRGQSKRREGTLSAHMAPVRSDPLAKGPVFHPESETQRKLGTLALVPCVLVIR